MLDMLRGFALLGIYISIIHSYNASIPYGNSADQHAGQWGEVIGSLSSLLINKRFIGILSLLFGIGIAIQQLNFKAKGVRFAPYFIKRMLILGGLGLVNTTFFFWGEILLVYAVFGLVTLAVSRVKPAILLGVAFLLFFVTGQYFEFAYRDDLIHALRSFPESYSADRMQEIYTSGSFLEMIKLRWTEYIYIYTDNNFHMSMSLAMILSGYVIGTGSYHTKFLASLPKFKKLFAFSALYSVIFLIYGLGSHKTDFIFIWDGPVYILYAIFLATTMFSYIYALCALHQVTDGKNWILKRLSQNGRISLTGYMGAACVFAIIFYGFELRMTYSSPGLTVIALLCYIGFSIFTALWLKEFKRGPIEWCFRRLSYGKLK